MGRTNDIRKVIKAHLDTLKTTHGIAENGVSYRLADPDAVFPHIVFNFTTETPMDMGREDYTLDIDIWTKDEEKALDLQDAVVDLFSFKNDPQTTILPTFYFTSAGQVEDPDKTICHYVVRFDTQNYRRTT